MDKGGLQMRLEQLNCLLAIDHYHSMNKAAEHIFVSQQSISVAVAQLEHEFQTSLVLRTNRGSFLTDAGKELIEATQEFYTRCDKIKKKNAENAETEKLHLLIDFSQLVFWENIYLYYAMHHPGIRLSRTLMNYDEIEENLKKQKESIAVVTLHSERLQEYEAKYNCKVCKVQKYVLYISKNSPLAGSNMISIRSLHDMQILIYSSEETPSAVYYSLQKYHLEERNNKFVYNVTTDLQKKLALNENVICFAPDYCLTDLEVFPFIPVKLKEKLILYLCCVTTKEREIPQTLIQAVETLSE